MMNTERNGCENKPQGNNMAHEHEIDIPLQNADSTSKKTRPISEWCLLILCSLCNALIIGYSVGIAVLFLDMKKSFNSSRAGTSLVQSINTGLMFGGGVVSSVVTSFMGVGNCCVLSGIAAFLAISSGYFSENLTSVVFSVGVIGGLSLSNIFTSLFIVVGSVFKENYHLGITCLILGAGIGSVVFPYLNLYLLETFGWRGTFLILGSILLHCCPIGMLIRIVLPVSSKSTVSQGTLCMDNLALQSHAYLWKNVVFVTFISCLILRSVPIGLVSYFMLDIAAYKHFDVSNGSFFLSVVGFGNLGGRLLALISRPIFKFSPVKEYSVYIIISGIAVFVLGFVKSYEFIVSACVLFGVAYGMLSGTAAVACFAIAGEDRYPTAVGIFNTAMGIGFGIAGPLGGVVRDNIDRYDHILFGFASVGTFAGLLLFVVACCYSKGSN